MSRKSPPELPAHDNVFPCASSDSRSPGGSVTNVPPEAARETIATARSNAGSEQTYSVGFGRPPQHSQFKPGQSGNPKGRAKQSRNLRTIVKQVLNEDMQIKEGDRIRRMPRVEALVRNTVSRAFKGDPRAFTSLSFLMRQSGYGDDHDESGTETLLGPNYQEIIDDFLARNLPQSAESETLVDRASRKNGKKP